MAPMLAVSTTEEQRFVVRYLWAKGFNWKDIHKEMFPVYGMKRLSRKAVHIWVEKFSQRHSKVADDTRPDVEVAETTVERRLSCGFRRTGKAMGQVYQCCWRIFREINVFSEFEYHQFYVFNLFVTYLLTLPLTLSHVTKFLTEIRRNIFGNTFAAIPVFIAP
jgi:hypothetical protein